MLFHAFVGFPVGGLQRWFERGAVAAAYIGVIVGASAVAWWSGVWTICVLIVFVVIVRRRVAFRRAAGVHLLPVLATFCGFLLLTTAMLETLGSTPAPRVVVLTYQAGIVLTAVFFAVRVAEWQRRSVTLGDAVVDLALGQVSDVRDLVSEALNDPSVEVAFAVSRDRTVDWVDERGRPIPALTTGARSVIPIIVDGRVVAEIASLVDVNSVPTFRSAVASATGLGMLTERERDVLAQLAEGRSNSGIAAALFIAERTVETHTTQIFQKLGLQNSPDTHRRVLAVLAYLRAND
jgi:DNA-binding CsgD family transcriptional regulator